MDMFGGAEPLWPRCHAMSVQKKKPSGYRLPSPKETLPPRRRPEAQDSSPPHLHHGPCPSRLHA